MISQNYIPELWTVQKDDIYSSIKCLDAGIDYARNALAEHDSNLGRTTRKNRQWAETMEGDIREMERLIDRLRKYSSATMPA